MQYNLSLQAYIVAVASSAWCFFFIDVFSSLKTNEAMAHRAGTGDQPIPGLVTSRVEPKFKPSIPRWHRSNPVFWSFFRMGHIWKYLWSLLPGKWTWNPEKEPVARRRFLLDINSFRINVSFREVFVKIWTTIMMVPTVLAKYNLSKKVVSSQRQPIFHIGSLS